MWRPKNPRLSISIISINQLISLKSNKPSSRSQWKQPPVEWRNKIDPTVREKYLRRRERQLNLISTWIHFHSDRTWRINKNNETTKHSRKNNNYQFHKCDEKKKSKTWFDETRRGSGWRTFGVFLYVRNVVNTEISSAGITIYIYIGWILCVIENNDKTKEFRRRLNARWKSERLKFHSK